MDVQHVHRQGVGIVNEDTYVINEESGVFAVIDGATGVVNDDRASGRIAAGIVGGVVRDWDGSGSILDVLHKANRELGIRQGSSGTGSDVPKEARSSCCLAAVQLLTPTAALPARLAYAQLGDCMLFVQYDNDCVRALTQDLISVFGGDAVGRFQNGWIRAANGEDPNAWDDARRTSTLRQLRQEATPQLIANRKRINTTGGYGVFDGSEEALSFLETGFVSLNRVQKILLLSDGLQLRAPAGSAGSAGSCSGATQSDWLETATFAFQQGLVALEAEVLRREAEDAACFRYPRLKPADDKTGILITL